MAVAVTEIPVMDLTPSEKRHLGALEKRIAAGLQTFREVGASLLEIRDSRLYRETHATFEAYCAERWGMNRVRAYQLIDSAKVVNTVELAPARVAETEEPRALVERLARGVVEGRPEHVVAASLRHVEEHRVPAARVLPFTTHRTRAAPLA